MTNEALVPIVEEPPRDMLSMNLVGQREDWAWLGGFIDGEGSIGMSMQRDGRRVGLRPSYRAAVQIANTFLPAMHRALQIMAVGGRVVLLAPPTERHKAHYHINIRSHGAVAITLARIMPYLIIKRQQAEIVLAYCQRRMAIRGMGRYAPFIPADHEAYVKLRQLNKRGPS